MHEYLDEHQINAVKALENLDEICKKYHIHFFLLAGSALGAIRHQGMIPWDDDIDVGMLYDDWYRLKYILPDELIEPFTYVDHEIDLHFPRLFGKILYKGQSCIDLFLIAKWTENPFLSRLLWQIRRTAVENFKFSLHYHSTPRPNATRIQYFRFKVSHACRKILYMCLCPFFEQEDFIRMARWCEHRFTGKDTRYYINLYSVYPMRKEMIKAEWIEKASYVEFEGKLYPTVADPDAYLTHLYGDYTAPPPEHNRKKMHQENFEVNKPYEIN